MSEYDLNNREIIKTIKKSFFSALPINDYLNTNVLKTLFIVDEDISLNNQLTIINETSNNALYLKYPYKQSYQRIFLKKIIDFLDSNDISIADELYNTFGRVVSYQEIEGDIFKQYLTGDDDSVILKESGCLIEQGSTGLRTWQSALALAEWCVQFKNQLKHKTIVELGCGIGLTGIVCLKLAEDIDKYYFTDYQTHVLSRLHQNIQLNLNINKNRQFFTYKTTEIHVKQLNWTEFNAKTCLYDLNLLPNNDIIVLGADIVFNQSIFNDLNRVICGFLTFARQVTVLLACTVRVFDTYRAFRDILESNESIVIVEFDAPEPRLFVWSNEYPIKFLQIKSMWCRKMTQGYADVHVDNMTTSWRDGLAFCALIHHFRPDLIDFNSLDKNDVYKNNELAFRVAECHLGIPALLDANDMVQHEVPDRLSILTYLSQFYQTLSRFDKSASSPRLTTDRISGECALRIPPPTTTNSPKVKLSGEREYCDKCSLPIYLAQRFSVSGHAMHRTCFRCARCHAQLAPANYYETELGLFCCETCPDEEPPPTSQQSAFLVRQIPLKDDIDSSQEFVQAKNHDVIQRMNELNKINDEILSRSVSDEEKTDKLSKSREDLEKFVDLGGQVKLEAINRVLIDTNETHNVIQDINAPDEVILRVEPKKISVSDLRRSFETKNITSERIQKLSLKETSFLNENPTKNQKSDDVNSNSEIVQAKNPVVTRNASDHDKNFNDKSVLNDAIEFIDGHSSETIDSQLNLQVNDTVKNELNLSNDETKLEMNDKSNKDVENIPEIIVSQSIESPCSEQDISNEENTTNNRLSNIQIDISRQQVENIPIEIDPSNATHEESVEKVAYDRQSSTELDLKPVQDLIEHLSEQIQYVATTSPKSEDLNPFGDTDNDDDGGDKSTVESKSIEKSRTSAKSPSKSSAKTSPKATNPFGDSDTDSDDDKTISESEKNASKIELRDEKTTSKVCLNPFGSDDEDDDVEVTMRTPIPAPRASKSTTPQAYPRFTRDNLRSSNTSIKSTASSQYSTLRKKRPAPPPPTTNTPNVTSRSPGSPKSTLTSRSSSRVSLISADDTRSIRSSTSRKNRPAPPPPTKKPTNIVKSLQGSFEQETVRDKSSQGQWKRKKERAPALPLQKRQINSTITLDEIREQLQMIEVQQMGLEKQGVKIEQIIRERCEGSDDGGGDLQVLSDIDAPLPPDLEDLVLQLFELVNEKNELFRKQAELMYLRRQNRLEHEHAEIEFEIRQLMLNGSKTDAEKAREEYLVGKLVEIVERRNEVVDCLDQDRLRERQEDCTISEHLRKFEKGRKVSNVVDDDGPLIKGRLVPMTKDKTLIKKIKKRLDCRNQPAKDDKSDKHTHKEAKEKHDIIEDGETRRLDKKKKWYSKIL